FISGHYVKGDFGLNQGFTTYKDRLAFNEGITFVQRQQLLKKAMTLLEIKPAIEDIMKLLTIEERNPQVLEWLDKNSEQQFFLFVHYYDAHTPYNEGKEYRGGFIDFSKYPKYDENLYGPPPSLNMKERYESRGRSTERIADYLSKLYATEIYYMDKHIQDLFDKLDELNLTEDTIVIITADHGEEFFEHGGWEHARTLYQEVINVPLIIRYPAKLAPQRVQETTSTLNSFATILDLAGIEKPNDVQSQSLIPVINGDKLQDEYVYSELVERISEPNSETRHSQYAIIKDGWKLLEIEPELTGVPSALYDLKTNPRETTNHYYQETEITTEYKQKLENRS
ncbi:MAG: sulfatase-like hydrolase/transferase, partial [Candidatus Diapherotrites archaeon]|nr:sulfatase-like hydrolase/transferase [Candidatus Diapherotrites archaeon]